MKHTTSVKTTRTEAFGSSNQRPQKAATRRRRKRRRNNISRGKIQKICKRLMNAPKNKIKYMKQRS